MNPGLPPGQLVVVFWEDAYFELDASDRPETTIVETVGWVLADTPGWLHLAGERTPSGNRAVSHIPRSIIREIAVVSVDGKGEGA